MLVSSFVGLSRGVVRRPTLSLVALMVALAPLGLQAQSWSGIIAPSRAVDWSKAGVTGGIPARTTICSTLNPGATAAQINSAISACPSGQVVMLNAGTYTLSAGIVFAKSGVTLRGAGADQTKLVINGTSSGCSVFYQSAIRMCAGTGNIGTTSSGSPGPDHSANWTSGYSQGTSVVTLSDTTGLVVGSTLFLDQLDDSSDGWPAAGDLFVCAGTAPCSGEGGNGFGRNGRAQQELHRVTNISGTNVTVDPPVMAANWRSAKSPGAWWGNSSVVLQNSGIENLTVDFTGGGGVGIEMVNNTDTWVKGVRLLQTGGPGSFVFHVLVVNGFRVTVKDNYFYGPTVPGNTQYTYTPHCSGSLLFENNILHHNIIPAAPNDPELGSVYAFNYADDAYYSTPGFQQHNAGDLYNLFEGNNLGNLYSDAIHGTHHFLTYFRNHLDGTSHNQSGGSATSAFTFWTHSRFFNVVGNVIGGPPFTTYETTFVDDRQSIYNLGYQGNCSNCGGMSNDSNVKRTLLRWGNYDSVTAGARFVSSEVPSTIPNFSNPVPSSQTLPASFYLSGKPAFIPASRPWPLIGPEVTGGDAPNSAGHAYKIPARVCFESAAVDPAYSGSSPRIKTFNAGSCYASGVSAPTAPTNLRITP
jgi:hypothetical protein